MRTHVSDHIHVSQDVLLFAMQQRNLVYNFNFLRTTNQTEAGGTGSFAPDGWLFTPGDTASAVGVPSGQNYCQITTGASGAVTTLEQFIHEFPRWESTLTGKRITAEAVLKNATNATNINLSVTLSDGVNTSEKTVMLLPQQSIVIEVPFQVSEHPTGVSMSISSSTKNAVFNVIEAYANLGEIALRNLPCMVEGTIGERKQYISTSVPPPTELSLCNLVTTLNGPYTRLSSFLNGKFGGGNGNGGNLANLPSIGGYFSRVWDNGAHNDPDADSRTSLVSGSPSGDNVGSVESFDVQSHAHGLKLTQTTAQAGAGTVIGTSPSPVQSTEKYGGKETRPLNIAELYTIKWA